MLAAAPLTDVLLRDSVGCRRVLLCIVVVSGLPSLTVHRRRADNNHMLNQQQESERVRESVRVCVCL